MLPKTGIPFPVIPVCPVVILFEVDYKNLLTPGGEYYDLGKSCTLLGRPKCIIRKKNRFTLKVV
jgi:hypothetical protein